MPSRKAEQIIKVLRDEILSGKRMPGEKLPTYDALMEQFHVTRPTVARVLDGLRGEGLVTVNGTRGVFIADRFPHHNRFFWVTSEQPGSLEWTSFLAIIFELIERKETGIAGDVVALVGVDGRENNPEYQRLCDAVEHGSAAGLLLMNSATVYLLPILQMPGIPRVAIWAPLPHAALLELDFPALIDRACARMLEKGKRIAVLSPHAHNLDAAQKRLTELGLAPDRLWALHVAPVGCERITQLLLDRPDRPDALFVTDDNLVEPVVKGLRCAKLKAGRDVYVLAHCNWPRPFGLADGIEHIGFDVREVLITAKEIIDAQRAGEPSPKRVIRPRFKSELKSFAKVKSD